MTDPKLSEADVARYWNDNADGWAAEVRQGHDVAREWLNNPEFLPFIGDVYGRRVLDAGCGEGYYAELGMFGEAVFDTVVSFMALMDGPRFDLAMKECFRVLRPGGTLGFSLMHPCFITNGVMDAGFTLRKFGEPRPSLEYCAPHPSQRGWRDHVAVFLHVRAEKP